MASKDDIDKVRELIYSLAGITLSDSKELMISNRLDKLISQVDYRGDVSSLLQDVANGKYVTEFINTFTTNKTNFFREDFHFEDLRDRILSNLSNGETINIYCSASSTGEEPYSIAMTVKEAERKYRKKIDAKIIATDIDTDVLQTAVNGIYRYDKSSEEFPKWIDPRRYFKKKVKKTLIGDEILIKVKDELKSMITFAKLNLSDEEYPFEEDFFDVIFCRNVLIYFTPNDQNIILKRLFRYLKMGGTLYIGHSESPQDLIYYTKKAGQNIFVKTQII